MLSLMLISVLGATVTQVNDDCTGNIAGSLSKAIKAGGTVTFALPDLPTFPPTPQTSITGNCTLTAGAVTLDASAGPQIFLQFNAFDFDSTHVQNLALNAQTATFKTAELRNTSVTTTGAMAFAAAVTLDTAVLDAGTTLSFQIVALVTSSALSATASINIPGPMSSTSITSRAGDVTLAAGATLTQSAVVVSPGHHVIANGAVRVIGSPIDVPASTLAGEVLDVWVAHANAPSTLSLAGAYTEEGGAAGVYGQFSGTAGQTYVLSFYKRNGNDLTNAGTFTVRPTRTDITTFTAPVTAVTGDSIIATLTDANATSAYTSPLTVNKAAVVFDAAGTVVDEFASTVTLTLRRAVTDGAVSLLVQTADGSATADVDYVAYSASVTFADGVATAPVTIAIIQDDEVEPEENFAVIATGATLDTTAAHIDVGIRDDDSDDGSTDPLPSGANTGSSGGCQSAPADPLAILCAALMIRRIRRRA